jgi:hypothetical protein
MNGKNKEIGAGLWGALTGTSNQPYQNRTGFDGNVSCVQAVFTAKGSKEVRIKATGWMPKD